MGLLINKLLACIVMVVIIAFSAAGWQGGEDVTAGINSGELIRFHVIANSDSPTDQALKLKVRDEVIRTMSPVLAGARDIDEARKLVDENVDIITRVSAGVLSKYGCCYPVRVERGTYGFPEKTYTIKCGDEGEISELTLAAGDYEAVRIVIGVGKGANWWCVLFPPLCFVNPVESESGGQGLNFGEEGISRSAPAETPAFKYDQIRPEKTGARPVIEYRFKAVELFMRMKDLL
ncbi:MAG: stage II sporulation protein R [Bacillota bacterium]